MRKFLFLAAAYATLAIAAPVSAHENEREHEQPSYSFDRSGGEIRQEFDHLEQGIRHGLDDGSLNHWQARGFQQQIWQLRRLESYERYQNGGYLSEWQTRDLNSRLSRLHEVMHFEHEEGHERQNDWDR